MSTTRTALPILRRFAIASAGIACLTLAACTVGPSNSRGVRGDVRFDTDYPTRPAAAPAPAPAPRAAPVSGDCRDYAPAAGADKNVTMMAFPTGDVRTSALLVHQVVPKQVRANQPFAHEIHVTNISSIPLENVVVIDESMRNMTLVDSDPRSGRGSDGSTNWNVGDLAPCQTKIIKINSRAGASGEASNCLSATYNSQLCALVEIVDPRLEIVKKAPSEVLICDNIPFEFVVKNAGTGAISNVVIKDTLAAGLKLADGRTSFELPVGTLAAGESRTLTATARAERTGSFENSATASSGDISASSNRTVTKVVQPKLAIACEADDVRFLGREATFKLTVRNTGDAACANTTVTATLPSGSTFVSATDGGSPSAGGVSWNIGALAAGASATRSFTVRGNTAGSSSVTATAACTCADPVSTTCATEFRGVPGVLLEVIDIHDPLVVGEETTYVITVTNQGSVDLTNIKIRSVLPSELEFVSCGGATEATSTGANVVFSPYGRLAPGGKAEWRIVVRAKGTGDIRFKTYMNCDQITVDVEETESTNLYK